MYSKGCDGCAGASAEECVVVCGCVCVVGCVCVGKHDLALDKLNEAATNPEKFFIFDFFLKKNTKNTGDLDF